MAETRMNDICMLNKADDIGSLMWQLIKIWQRGRRKILNEFGLTWSQMEVLGSIGYLQSNNEQITQIALSQNTSIDPMTISTILRNLHKKGLISRMKCETDMRARAVELTETGLTLLQKAYAKAKENRQIVLETVDEEVFVSQIKNLLSALNKLETQYN
jgi:DNA-binding MarR family transcriptional regulator